MRIAHLVWSMGVGGAQTLLTGIANIQVRSGHEVGIFIVDNRIDDTIISKLDPRIEVFYFGRTKGTFSIMPFVKLNRQLWRFRPDIIHSHAGRLSKVILSRVPMVVTFHNTRLDPNNFKRYKKGFAISDVVKDDIVKSGYKGDVVVIDNGVPCDEIRCKTDFKRGDTVHVIQVSRIFFHQKRQDLAVQALSKLKEKLKDTQAIRQSGNQAITKCVMHFVGDGPDMDSLKALVSELGLDDDVVLEGLKDRNWVLEHLCDYDLFLQPSDFEGFGLTVAEACAAKLPVLVSDVDGPLEVIDGGRLGMVFRHGNADDLADKLFQFIRDGYDTSIVEKAYQNTVERYSIVRTTQRYVEEYEKVINNQNQ